MATSTRDSKKSPVRRWISLTILITALFALFLALKKPAPVSLPQPSTLASANAASFHQKVDQLAQTTQDAGTGKIESPEIRLSSDEIAAALAQATGMTETASGSDSAENPAVSAPLVTMEGDVVKGQFESEIGGKKVYVTVAGHLGAKDGYATFEPTEFKVGDLAIPVSMVNGALQKRMAEQRDRLKLPDFVGDLKVENGELVIRPK